ncbi:TIGR03943 family protein, partial [candidate division FCPU426 bacterium]|nr:TIGR03943 family protein [candidate division FCPU426 bacterium]
MGPRLPGLLVFGTWVAVYGWLWAGGAYRNFLRPALWPLLLLGLLMFSALMLQAIGQSRADCAQHVRTGYWLTALIFLAPLALLLSAHNHSLGAFALDRRAFEAEGITTAAPRATPTPATSRPGLNQESVRPKGPDFSVEPNVVTLLEINKFYEQISGHRLIAKGQVHRGERTPAGHFVLFQFMITCCIADARPLAILVESKEAEHVRENSWVRVEGILHTRQLPGVMRLVIQADTVEDAPRPERDEKYL